MRFSGVTPVLPLAGRASRMDTCDVHGGRDHKLQHNARAGAVTADLLASLSRHGSGVRILEWSPGVGIMAQSLPRGVSKWSRHDRLQYHIDAYIYARSTDVC